MGKRNYKYKLDRLRDYAQWYISNFLVSHKKLYKKLEEKALKEEDLKVVFEEIKNVVSEPENIKARIRSYLSKGKDFFYIKNKLTEQEYSKDLIEVYLNKFKEKLDNNRYLYYDKQKLIKKIEVLGKKFGKNKIIIKLASNNSEKKYLEQIIKKNHLLKNNDLKEQIIKYINKKGFDIKDYNEKSKVLKYFASKGFLFPEINNILKEL